MYVNTVTRIASMQTEIQHENYFMSENVFIRKSIKPCPDITMKVSLRKAR